MKMFAADTDHFLQTVINHQHQLGVNFLMAEKAAGPGRDRGRGFSRVLDQLQF